MGFKDRSSLFGIILFGSVWGILEVLTDGLLHVFDFHPRAPILAAAGIFVLMTSRMLFNRPGSSAAIGVVAALFKLFEVPCWPCKLYAVALQGVVFDGVFTLLDERTERWKVSKGFIGSIAVWVSFAVFALSMTYLIRYYWWVIGGLPKVLHHILVSGGYAALGSFFAALLGVELGAMVRPYFAGWQLKPGLYYTGTSLIVCAAWLIAVLL